MTDPSSSAAAGRRMEGPPPSAIGTKEELAEAEDVRPGILQTSPSNDFVHIGSGSGPGAEFAIFTSQLLAT
jgi:hypothetical protein